MGTNIKHHNTASLLKRNANHRSRFLERTPGKQKSISLQMGTTVERQTPNSLQMGTNVTPYTGFALGKQRQTPFSLLTCFHRNPDTSAPPSEPSLPGRHQPPPETGMHCAPPRPPMIRPAPATWRQVRPGRFRPAEQETNGEEKYINMMGRRKKT